MNDRVKESMKVKGFTYLGKVEGKEVFCNLDSEDSIEKCLEYLEDTTGEEWGVFEESGGDKNLVFYKKSMYRVEVADMSYLRYCGGKGLVKLPLNCSSCYFMFSEMDLSSDVDFSGVDTSNVKYMTLMFYASNILSGFSLGNNFDTSKVECMNDMFRNCVVQPGFRFGDKFSVTRSSCRELLSYFDIPDDLDFGASFCIESTEQFLSMLSYDRMGRFKSKRKIRKFMEQHGITFKEKSGILTAF